MKVHRMRNVKYYLAALVGLVTFLVYLPALRNGFVEWDDIRYVVENPAIRTFDMAFLRWAFLDFHISNWHPLTWVSHALDYAIWGLDPMGHHLTSIVLHAINTFVVVLLVARLMEIARKSIDDKISPNPSLPPRTGGFAEEKKRGTAVTPTLEKGDGGGFSDRWVLIAAGVTGLLFGIHPLHVESVAWVSERKDLLCALFFLLSIMAYVKYVRRGGSMWPPTEWQPHRVVPTRKDPGQAGMTKPGRQFLIKHYLPALGFFALALLSKPMAVSLPVVLLILDWYPFGRIVSLKTAWQACVEKIPFFALSLASSVVTIFAQRSGGAIASSEVVPLSIRILVAAKSLIVYIWKMIVPLDLIPFYPYPKDVSLTSFEYLLMVALVIGITAACIITAKRQRAWLSAWGYFVVTLLPVLGIVQVGAQAMADRYTYLPSIGPFLVVGSMSAWTATKAVKAWGKGGNRLFAALGALVLIAISFFTVRQIRIWHDSIMFWSYELEKVPDANIAYVNRGIAYMKLGQLDEAIKNFTEAISRKPSDYKAFYSRAGLFARLNLVSQAIADYSAAIALKPSYYEAYNNRGVLYERMGQLDRAMADYNSAISLNPSNYQAYSNRGLVNDRSGQVAGALADFDKAISLNPNDPNAYYNRGIIFGRTGQVERALADFDKAIELTPNDPDAYYHRGIILGRAGQLDRALADFDKAIALKPTSYQTYYQRGVVLQKIGRTDEANRAFMKWKEYSPKK